MIPPLGEKQINAGTYFPRKEHLGPPGNRLPDPEFARIEKAPSTIENCIYTPRCWYDMSSCPGKMISHMTGSPVAAVNPKIVKCASEVAAAIFDFWPFYFKNRSPPTFPSSFMLVFFLTSSTNSMYSWCFTWCVTSTPIHFSADITIHLRDSSKQVHQEPQESELLSSYHKPNCTSS